MIGIIIFHLIVEFTRAILVGLQNFYLKSISILVLKKKYCLTSLILILSRLYNNFMTHSIA